MISTFECSYMEEDPENDEIYLWALCEATPEEVIEAMKGGE